MYDLFPDQQEIMNDLRAAMLRHKSILLQSPTGSGKTGIATNMIGASQQRGRRAIMGFPRVALLEQTHETFKKHGITHSFIASGFPFNPFADVYLGMTETMAKWIENGKMVKRIDLYIPDETHVGSKALATNINHFKLPWFDEKAKQRWTWEIGLSATPWRMDGVGLGIYYDAMVQGRQIKWLIENKRLSQYRLFQGQRPEDFQRLARLRDDELAEAMTAARREIVGDCVREYKERALGKLWVVRCSSIETSEITAEAFRAAGVNAVHVDGETKSDMRRKIFQAFARREILVLTFADLLNFGFDLSQASGMDVCIEGGSDLKPSDSLAGQLQFWGRLLRYKDFPAFIHDHVNNWQRHGLPCMDRDWTLDSLKKSQRGGDEKVPATRQCPACLVTDYAAQVCRNCGHEFEVESRFVKQVDGQLHELDLAHALTLEQAKKHSAAVVDPLDEFLPVVNQEERLEGLIRYAVKEGIKNPINWAANELAKINSQEYV